MLLHCHLFASPHFTEKEKQRKEEERKKSKKKTVEECMKETTVMVDVNLVQSKGGYVHWVNLFVNVTDYCPTFFVDGTKGNSAHQLFGLEVKLWHFFSNMVVKCNWIA